MDIQTEEAEYRAEAIAIISASFPSDAANAIVAQRGTKLLNQAKIITGEQGNKAHWTDHSTRTLVRYAELCLFEVYK